jgi:GH25 family lysozyme M1 (1,4-beta-N-acetylmuramidase)
MPRLDGIDIYHGQAAQGPVDLATVAAIPTWWFACKATQSTSFVDPKYHEFIAAAGPLFSHRLGYHWTSSITDPLAQADHFLNATGGLPEGGAMQDMEEAGITVAKCLAWFERVEDHTHRPGVGYSGLYVTGGACRPTGGGRSSLPPTFPKQT